MTLITRTVAFLTLLFLSFNSNANTLKIGVGAIGENLDFRYTLDANGYHALRLMSSGLIAGVEEESPLADLIDKKPLHYTFKLKDLNFTNGEIVDSQTIKDIYLDLMNNKKITVYKGTLKNIKSIDILDKKTLRFNFKQIDNFPEAKFTLPLFKQTKNGMVGVGPYIIEDFKFPYTLNLKSVDPTLHYQNIQFIPNSMPVVRILKLLKGEVDVLHGNLQAMQTKLLEKKGFDINASDGSNYAYLGFNLKNKIVGNKAVRKAIAYGLDIDSVVHYLYADYAKKAKSLLNLNNKNYKSKEITRDINKAIKILEQAGFKANKDGVRLEIDFSITTNNQSLRYAQIIQDQLKDVGIKVNIQTSDWGRFYNDIKDGNVQMYALAWVGIFDGDVYKDLFHSESIGDNGLNRSFYKNKQMDKLIDKLVSQKLTEKQMKNTLFAIQDLQFNDMIYVPLWKKQNIVVFGKGVKQYKPTLDGAFDAIKNIKKD